MLNLLQKGEVISLVLYPGHHEGFLEKEAIEHLVCSLSQKDYDVLRYQFANRPVISPYALILKKN